MGWSGGGGVVVSNPLLGGAVHYLDNKCSEGQL